MNARPHKAMVQGYRAVSPVERAGFGMTSAFATTIGVSRANNYLRERNRRAPRLRSWGHRAYNFLGHQHLRVHPFVPGIGLILAAGGTAILTRTEGTSSC